MQLFSPLIWNASSGHLDCLYGHFLWKNWWVYLTQIWISQGGQQVLWIVAKVYIWLKILLSPRNFNFMQASTIQRNLFVNNYHYLVSIIRNVQVKYLLTTSLSVKYFSSPFSSKSDDSRLGLFKSFSYIFLNELYPHILIFKIFCVSILHFLL